MRAEKQTVAVIEGNGIGVDVTQAMFRIADASLSSASPPVSTVRYLGCDLEDVLSISKGVEI